MCMRACYSILLCLLATACPGCGKGGSKTPAIDAAEIDAPHIPFTDPSLLWERLSKKMEQALVAIDSNDDRLSYYGNKESRPTELIAFLRRAEPGNENIPRDDYFFLGSERPYDGRLDFAEAFLSTTIEAKPIGDNLLLQPNTFLYPGKILYKRPPPKEEWLLLLSGRLDINVLVNKFRWIEQDKNRLVVQLQIAREDTQKHNRYLALCLLVIVLLFLLFVFYQRRSRVVLAGILDGLPGAEQEYSRLAGEVQDEIDKGMTPVRLDPGALHGQETDVFPARFPIAGTYPAMGARVWQAEAERRHSPVLPHAGLHNTLTVWARQFNTTGGVKVHVDSEGPIPSFPDLTVLHLYRIITTLTGKLWGGLKEGTIRVGVTGDPSTLYIDIIAGNPKGAVANFALEQPDLDNIWERTRLLGGTVNRELKNVAALWKYGLVWQT